MDPEADVLIGLLGPIPTPLLLMTDMVHSQLPLRSPKPWNRFPDTRRVDSHVQTYCYFTCRTRNLANVSSWADIDKLSNHQPCTWPERPILSIRTNNWLPSVTLKSCELNTYLLEHHRRFVLDYLPTSYSTYLIWSEHGRSQNPILGVFGSTFDFVRRCDVFVSF